MRVLVTGAAGTLGSRLVTALAEHGHDCVACDRARLDITDPARALTVLEEVRPDAVVHCAALTNVDAAETDPDLAFRVNGTGTANVARAAAHVGARLVAVSTDYVFDGARAEPYAADAVPNPLGVYGRSKLEGERAARLAGDWLVVRVSWVYGRGGRNFGSRLLERARAGETLHAFTDMRSAPTWTHDAADTIRLLLEKAAPSGIYHGCNAGGATWCEFARAALDIAGVHAEIVPTRVAELSLPAPRPHYSVMDVRATESVIGSIPDWRDALERAIREGL